MRRHLDWLIPILVLLGALALRIQDGPVVAELREKVFDTYQSLKPRAYNPQLPVRVLAIDDESLRRVGQWPWSRATMAQIMDRLTGAGAAVALDILLAEPDRTSPQNMAKLWEDLPNAAALQTALAGSPDPDTEFAKALGRGPTVTAFALNDAPGGETPLIKAGFATAGDSPLPFLLGWPGATPP